MSALLGPIYHAHIENQQFIMFIYVVQVLKQTFFFFLFYHQYIYIYDDDDDDDDDDDILPFLGQVKYVFYFHMATFQCSACVCLHTEKTSLLN